MAKKNNPEEIVIIDVEPIEVTEVEETEEVEVVEENKQEFNEEELVKTLIASGIDEEIAKQTAANVAKQKAGEAAKSEEKKESENDNVNPRPWFKRAVVELNLPRKQSLISELMMQQITADNEAEKAEIQKEIDRLMSDKGDDRFEVLMNGYIIPTKKWTITESGKIAEFAYTTGDYVHKGVAGVTRTVGKATKWTGEQMAKGGQKMQDNAEKAGKIASKPFYAAGQGIDKMSSKKDDKKK